MEYQSYCGIVVDNYRVLIHCDTYFTILLVFLWHTTLSSLYLNHLFQFLSDINFSLSLEVCSINFSLIKLYHCLNFGVYFCMIYLNWDELGIIFVQLFTIPNFSSILLLILPLGHIPNPVLNLTITVAFFALPMDFTSIHSLLYYFLDHKYFMFSFLIYF